MRVHLGGPAGADHATRRPAQVHHAWPVAPDGALELGDRYTREPRRVLVEWFVRAADDVDPAAGPPVGAVAEVAVEAHVVTAGGGVERVAITLPVAVVPGKAGEAPAIVREALLQQAARAREGALAGRDRGDCEGGSTALAQAALVCEAAPPLDADAAAEVAREAADLWTLAAAFGAGAVSAADAKYLGQMAYASARGEQRGKERLRRGGA